MPCFRRVAMNLGAAVLCLWGASCGTKTEAAKTCSAMPPPVKKAMASYKVGFSQIGAEGTNPFRLTETSSMQGAAAQLGVTLKVLDAAGDANQQAKDMNSLISGGYDAIFLAPYDTTTLVPQILAAREACIPVFLVDRDVDHTLAVPGKDYVTFMGSDFALEGNRVANWMFTATNTQDVHVLELLGSAGASPTILRQQGFESAVASVTRISLPDGNKLDGNFDRATAQGLVHDFLPSHPEINFIYAHNDEMGLGAHDAMLDPNYNITTRHVGGRSGQAFDGTQDILISSMDGEHETFVDIAQGSYGVLVTCSPRFGPLAFQAWQNYLDGQSVATWTVVQDTLIDVSNANNLINLSF